jgi:hypothetical protein
MNLILRNNSAITLFNRRMSIKTLRRPDYVKRHNLRKFITSETSAVSPHEKYYVNVQVSCMGKSGFSLRTYAYESSLKSVSLEWKGAEVILMRQELCDFLYNKISFIAQNWKKIPLIIENRIIIQYYERELSWNSETCVWTIRQAVNFS